MTIFLIILTIFEKQNVRHRWDLFGGLIDYKEKIYGKHAKAGGS